MFYLLPAWYNEDNSLDNLRFDWSFFKENFDFDESFSLARMLDKQNEPYRIIVPTYSPHLRKIFNYQNLSHANCICLFDLLQSIKNEPCRSLAYNFLNNHKNIEWFNFHLTKKGFLNNDLIYEIHYGNDGEIIWINRFVNGQIYKRFIVDDRGFISSVDYYSDNSILYRLYYNNEGIWTIRDEFDNGVFINKEIIHDLKQDKYSRIEEPVTELLQITLNNINQDDRTIIACHKKNFDFVKNLNLSSKCVLSIFNNRHDFIIKEYKQLVANKFNRIVVDTNYKKNKLLNSKISINNIHCISPIDSRLQIGHSNQIKELKIFLEATDLTRDEIINIVETIECSIKDINNVYLYISTSDRFNLESIFKDKYKYLNNRYFYIPGANDYELISEYVTFWDEYPEQNLFISEIHTESQMAEQLKDIRLVIDPSDKPNVFLQIAAISIGIPQINYVYTGYVEHKKNGLIIKNKENLSKGIHYYLGCLENWNYSLAYNYNKSKEFSGERIIEKWKNI